MRARLARINNARREVFDLKQSLRKLSHVNHTNSSVFTQAESNSIFHSVSSRIALLNPEAFTNYDLPMKKY